MAERKIAGMEIRVDRPLATEALKLQARLMRAAGGAADQLPSILGEMRAAQTDEAKQAIGVKLIGVLTDIFDRLDADEYVRLVGDIVAMAKIKRPSGQYDRLDLDGDLTMNLGAIIPVAAFVLKEVFGDFFSGALANGNRGAMGTA
ncbi:phage tail assembly chaperone [Shinella sp. DD12]|uniref:phage tail assembly chaperone n=1 Tax=Shinella sp. DD12 TaxID=1410620 RepID=UPI0003C55E3D|nr:hypothetical protein [Shinella sp. DD12]EYR81384.1 hypothetical protein SHLA_15c000690 [Shinella sp. DD12]